MLSLGAGGEGGSESSCSGHVMTEITPAEWPMLHRAVASIPLTLRTEAT